MIYKLDELSSFTCDKSAISNVYIDVGTAIDAPHSAKWMLEDKNALVVAVEPNPACIETLKVGRPPTNFHYLRLNDSKILLEGNEIQTIKENQFLLINCAIDDVVEKTTASFYCTDERNIGCSSLLEPTPDLGLDFEKREDVEVTSLEYILDSLGLQDLVEIRFVKTDTQGKDFDAVRSLRNQYHAPNLANDFIKFMEEKKFSILFDSGYDLYMLNHPLALKLQLTQRQTQYFFDTFCLGSI